jgi:putative peptidoglycan lipid II flippase
MGLLNALGHFAAPALAPALLNLGIIGAVVTAVRFSADPTFLSYALAIGVLIGGCMQLALQIPFLVKCGIDFWRRADWRHPGLVKIRTMLVPVIFGGSVFQINTLIGTLLASFLVEGSISYLYYADRLVQLPLGLFGIATATAIMPTLSRQAATQNVRALVVTLQYAVRLLALIMLPAMVGIIVVREPVIALLFEHGAFDARASRLTADAVLYYGIGLWAFAAIRIVIATFYALGDTRTPARIAVVCLLANVVLGLVLMEYMGHGGIALALTLATVLNLLLLVRPLRRRLGPLGADKLLGSVAKSLAAAAIMGLAVWWMVLNWLNRTTLFNHLVGLTAIIAAGVLIYTGLTILLQGRQVVRLLNPKKQAFR